MTQFCNQYLVCSYKMGKNLAEPYWDVLTKQTHSINTYFTTFPYLVNSCNLTKQSTLVGRFYKVT